MYSACLHCHAPLGSNETFPTFEVGRRIAYDPAKGRLWVICPACARWNLSPLEERWEAIDVAERRQERAKQRVATDNISLTRLPEGTELVRIGGPTRTELAVWRYGDAFRRRRKKALVVTGSVIGIGIAGMVSVAFAGMTVIGLLGNAKWLETYYREGAGWRTITRLRDPATRRIIPIKPRDVRLMSLRSIDGELALHLGYEQIGRYDRWYPHPVDFRGPKALVALKKILPGVNRMGGTRPEVDRALERLEDAGGAEGYFRAVARTHGLDADREPVSILDRAMGHAAGAAGLYQLPRSVALAIEMAVHEDQERRAMEGELAELEAQWREAEEIARIADDMFLPDDVPRKVETLKRKATRS